MSILKRVTTTWDRPLPILAGVLLFLEVYPPHPYGRDIESLRVLAQIPLVALSFLAAHERRFAAALVLAGFLAFLQGLPSLQAALGGRWSLETIFPGAAWIAMLASYLHPTRREVYFGDLVTKEIAP